MSNRAQSRMSPANTTQQAPAKPSRKNMAANDSGPDPTSPRNHKTFTAS